MNEPTSTHTVVPILRKNEVRVVLGGDDEFRLSREEAKSIALLLESGEVPDWLLRIEDASEFSSELRDAVSRLDSS